MSDILDILLSEDLRKWFGKGKEGGVGGGGWDRYNTKGERIGKCAAPDRGATEGKPKCLSKEKAAQLRAKGGKKAIANAVKRKKAQDSVTDRPGTGNVPKYVSSRIKEQVTDDEAPVFTFELEQTLSEKNVPTNPSLWSRAKSEAKKRFDVYPSAYANGWAAKWYKERGGGWRTSKSESVQSPLHEFTQGKHVVLVAKPKNPNDGDGRGYWKIGDQVYRGQIKNVLFDINQEPSDKRWESSWEQFKKNFDAVYGQFYVKTQEWSTIAEENTPTDREWGSDSLVKIYKKDTPGELDEFFGINYQEVDSELVKDFKNATPGQDELLTDEPMPSATYMCQTCEDRMPNDSIVEEIFESIALVREVTEIKHMIAAKKQDKTAEVHVSTDRAKLMKIYDAWKAAGDLYDRIVQGQLPAKATAADIRRRVAQQFGVGMEKIEVKMPPVTEELTEDAEYQGRKVKLGKPFRTPGGPKKFSVYVKNDKGNVVKVNFGDPKLSIKRDDPERRKNFRARHGCDNPGPRWKAKYWSCRFWSKKSVTNLIKEKKRPGG